MRADPARTALSPGDGAMILQRADELAAYSADGPNVLTRLYLTPEHRAAAACVADWMRDAGLATRMDAAGTIVGRIEGARADAPTLLIGSHIDTVRNAGKYDGNLGVILAIQALRRLTREGVRLPYAVEILAFGDEEGVRFPVTLTSSRAIAGTFDARNLDVADAGGVTLRAALKAFGGDPDALAACARDRARIAGYVEVHIEQGPVLEQQDLAVGVVTAIAGASRLAVTVDGFAGHAGTVPMTMRRDAGAAAAEMVLAVERVGHDHGVVATVGQMRFAPGAVNVIPSRAEFTVDLRSASDADRLGALAALTGAFADIAGRRHVAVSHAAAYEEKAATCDPALVAGLAAAATACGHAAEDGAALRLPSGAGHDGLAMAALCPFAMLFVRCEGGISHNPAEAITAEDAQAATDVVARFLKDFRA